MKRKTGGLNKSLHTECNSFLCPGPEHRAARWKWGKKLNTPEKRAIGTDSWHFCQRGLLYSDAHQSESLHNIQENFQGVFWYLVFKYEWPAQNYMTFEGRKLSNRKKNMRL